MNLFVYSLLPALLLLIYGGLLAMWLQLAGRPDQKLEWRAIRVGWYALGAYALWMLLVTVHQKQVPILSVGQLLAFLGLLVWADQTYLQQRIRQRLLVVLPLVTVIVLLLTSVVIGIQPNTHPKALTGVWSAFHITLSLAGVAMLLGGGVFGAGAMMLHRQITQREFGPLFTAMPPLGDMNRLRSITLYIGWWMITLSLASSITWMIIENGGLPVFFTHLHAMVGLWLVISVLVLSERKNWLGQHKQARMSVALSALILFMVMASVLEMFLGGRA
jgi:ABC-type uncharacterized transport system permease subunit